MNMKSLLILLVSVSLAIPLAAAITNKGADQIELNGGTSGSVAFPHHRHQTDLGDCNLCHEVFPQTPGAIDALKAQGALKPKHVMNKMCIKCHRAEKKAGNPSGPTTCSKCHTK